MDKFNAMNTFVKIVECGSLTAAAVALDKSLPSVVRILANYEKQLDTRLLHRTTRSITLTDEGREYLQSCKTILADVEDAEQTLSIRQSRLAGSLKITAPVMFGTMYITPILTKFLKTNKQIELDLGLDDGFVDLTDNNIDVAIRISQLNDASIIAIPVGRIRRVVCASPRFLKTHKALDHPDQLKQSNCIRFTGISAHAWKFREQNKNFSVPIKGSFTCNQNRAAIKACVDGIGFGMFLSYQIAKQINRGELEIVLSGHELPAIPVYVVYASAKLMSARVRAIVDYLVKNLKAANIGTMQTKQPI